MGGRSGEGKRRRSTVRRDDVRFADGNHEAKEANGADEKYERHTIPGLRADHNWFVHRSPPPGVNAGSRRQAVGLFLVAGVVVAASVLFSPGRVLGAVEGLVAKPAQFALALATLYLLRPLVAWPLSLFSVLVGYAYGPVVGFPVALVGTVASCLPPFLVARHVRTDVGFLGSLSHSGERFFEATGGVRGTFAARLAPAPADAISYGAGLAGIPTRSFVAGTILGEIPWTAVFVLVGASVAEFSVEEATLDSAAFVLAAAALALVVIAGPAYRYLADRRGGGPVPGGSADER
jgi:uncharacterized membrane protein YdjX (TVP38/TMEM64 family)